jgi:hypothetical protein
MNLTTDGVVLRDLTVFEAALSRKIPILMVLSGGYQLQNAPCIALSISTILDKFNLTPTSSRWVARQEEAKHARPL